MTRRTLSTMARAGLLAASMALAPAAQAQHADPAWAERLWDAADTNQGETVLELVRAQVGADDSFGLYTKNIEGREALRTERIAEVSAELDERIALIDTADHPDIAMSNALVSAIELQLMKDDQDAFMADPRIPGLIARGERAARAAEDRADWLVASELFYRLNSITEDEGLFDEDSERLGDRLQLLRLYTPERLWELRNARRLMEEEDGFPPYNAYGDGFMDKLEQIEDLMVQRALMRATRQFVERQAPDRADGKGMRDLLVGGLTAVETMVTTIDLRHAFPGLNSDRNRERFLTDVRALKLKIENKDWIRFSDMQVVIEDVMEANAQSVGIMQQAVLHEFGNGAFGELDNYSAIIWPDELARFRRSTQGEFTGVGIQIQLDELSNIKVATVLTGTPAQRAGIRSDDLIRKVDGVSAIGFTLDQAVEVITGPRNSRVVLTVERPLEEDGEFETLELPIVRQVIDLPTVKGWEKIGPADDEWDWFIDEGVGFVRLTGFTEHTTRDFDAAIRTMKDQGLDALVLDLRFNPGGLMDQAVALANRFVDQGLILETVDGSGRPASAPKLARAMDPQRSLAGVPVVVLINEGSASASEILSGAIQAGADQGKLQALVVGKRSFGKGSVQNVYPLNNGLAAMKLTTQYYRIDSPRIIHKRPGATEWGIEPDLEVEMLPQQITDMLMLRRDADVLPVDEFGNILADAERPDPDTLLTEGTDLQALTALVLLESQRIGADQTAKLDN